MKLIAVIGAFDRYNYGDLLFPIVLEQYFKIYAKKYIVDFELKYYGIAERDLSEYGGKKTENIEQFFKDVDSSDESVVIVSGGEVLGATWEWMYDHVSTNYFNLGMKKILKTVIGRNHYEKYVRKRLGARNKFPWIVSNQEFKSNCKVIYNSVGGATIRHLKSWELSYIRERLNSAEYFSVRDIQTKANFSTGKENLVPDSVVILSDIFSIEYLQTVVREEIKAIANNKYICFQINLSSSKGKEKIIANQLEKIYIKYKYKLVLLPIGTAPGHFDDIGLKNIQKVLKVESQIPNSIGVYETMYLLANSSMFIGASLHGAITAQSYGKPHINIDKGILKTEYYNKTWNIKESSGNIEAEKIFEEFEKVIKISPIRYEENREKMIKLAHENLKNIINVIKST